MKNALLSLLMVAGLTACNKDVQPDYSATVAGRYAVSGSGFLTINRISNAAVSVDYTANNGSASRIVEIAYVTLNQPDQYTLTKRGFGDVGAVNLAGTRASVLGYNGTVNR